jgi:hypothetical protein
MMLHRRLAATLLVMALLGANSAAAFVCQAYCAEAGKNNTVHHQIETRASPSSHQIHAHHADADCQECLKAAGPSSLQRPKCGSVAQVLALQEIARASSTDRKVLQLDVNRTSANSFQRPVENARFLPSHSPPQINSFERVLVSLRI